jgi:hypothetical protein
MLRPRPRRVRRGEGMSVSEGRRTLTSVTSASSVTPAMSICEQCYHHRLRCAACGAQVGAQAFTPEGDSRFYCRECFEQYPHCDTCDRPVVARRVPSTEYRVPSEANSEAPLDTRYSVLSTGRNLCDRCRSTAVTDPNAAHALYGRVKAALSRQIGMSLREPCQLKLVSRDQIVSLVDSSLPYNLDAGSRGRCFGLFMRQGAHRAIYIESGLPQIVLLEVLAHEYAHAWQSENCHTGDRGHRQSPTPTPASGYPRPPIPDIQEGFAEWVAYKLLQHWGCRRRSDRMLRRDDLYGRGLKLVLAWETEGGVPEVFRRVRGYA